MYAFVFSVSNTNTIFSVHSPLTVGHSSFQPTCISSGTSSWATVIAFLENSCGVIISIFVLLSS